MARYDIQGLRDGSVSMSQQIESLQGDIANPVLGSSLMADREMIDRGRLRTLLYTKMLVDTIVQTIELIETDREEYLQKIADLEARVSELEGS